MTYLKSKQNFHNIAVIIIILGSLISCNGQINKLNSQNNFPVLDSLFKIDEYATAKTVIDSLKKTIVEPNYLLKYEAMYYHQKGERENAKKYYLEAAKFEPENSNIYTNLGKLYMQENQLIQSENSFNKALQINPQSSYGALNLANLYGISGHYKLALKTLETYIKDSTKTQPELSFFYMMYHYTYDFQKRDSIAVLLDRKAPKAEMEKLDQMMLHPIERSRLENTKWIVTNIEEDGMESFEVSVLDYKLFFGPNNKISNYDSGEEVTGTFSITNRSLKFYSSNGEEMASFIVLMVSDTRLVLYEVNQKTTTTLIPYK